MCWSSYANLKLALHLSMVVLFDRSYMIHFIIFDFFFGQKMEK